MEATPEEISQFHTQAEIKRRLDNSLAALDYVAIEKRALKLHPKPFRPLHVVPAEIRQGEVDFIASQMSVPPAPASPDTTPVPLAAASPRSPRRKKHVLP